MINNYISKISGPLLDRIDIQIKVKPIEFRNFNEDTKVETSKEIRDRVNSARNIQKFRYKNLEILCNNELTPKLIEKYCKLDSKSKTLIEKAFKTLKLTARGYSRVLKVARTIADLDGKENIQIHHIAEALQYRILN